MTSIFLNSLYNTSFIDVIKLYFINLSGYTTSLSELLLQKDISSKTWTLFGDWPGFLYINEFQWKLLKGFTFILFFNLVLICLSWKIYGKRISERFMKPATSKAIEELKASVSKLKLPKEHTPRI